MGIRNRYWKFEFTKGVFRRIELLGTQENDESTQDRFGIVHRHKDMSVQAIELRKGDIAQRVNYDKDGLEALHGPMLCQVHMLHHRRCRCEDELSGCPLHESLNSVLGWPIEGEGMW